MLFPSERSPIRAIAVSSACMSTIRSPPFSLKGCSLPQYLISYLLKQISHKFRVQLPVACSRQNSCVEKKPCDDSYADGKSEAKIILMSFHGSTVYEVSLAYRGRIRKGPLVFRVLWDPTVWKKTMEQVLTPILGLSYTFLHVWSYWFEWEMRMWKTGPI